MSNGREQCLECNGHLPEGRTKFCSDQCGGRNRVRKHRRGETSSDIGKAARQQIEARATLRRGAKVERDALIKAWRQSMKDYRLARTEMKSGKKRIAAELKVAIVTSDCEIAQEFDKQVQAA
jgi:hypothetical protein